MASCFVTPKAGHFIHSCLNRSMKIQGVLGSDIAMVLDECPSYRGSREGILNERLREQPHGHDVVLLPASAARRSSQLCKGGTSAMSVLRMLGHSCIFPFLMDGYAIGGRCDGIERSDDDERDYAVSCLCLRRLYSSAVHPATNCIDSGMTSRPFRSCTSR